jgi:hypothetical protein
MKGEIYMSNNSAVGAPSAVFAIYFGNRKPTFNHSSIGGVIIETVSDFTPFYRWDSCGIEEDNGILTLWNEGKVWDVQEALEKALPGIMISLLAN